ncbi:MAG TPA: hypothetical protein VF244_00825 [Acidimicrobiales bacterium]
MRRGAVLGFTAALAVALAACSGGGTPATPSPTPTTLALGPLGFSDADNGRTVTAGVGQRVTVILHSSEFVFSVPSDPDVLRAEGTPAVTPSPATCVELPGSGCGTVVASFLGLAPGQAELAAERPGCAEPECGPGDARWQLAVRVVDTTATTAAPQAEVVGTVRFSPVCPVESDPPDPACAPRPGRATVELARADGIVVALDRTGDDGAFAITVPPGAYQVLAFPAQAAGVGGGCQADPAEVTVAADTSTTVAVSCDTGIR